MRKVSANLPSQADGAATPALTKTKKSVKNDGFYEKYGLKKWVYRLIFGAIIIGLVVPFFAEVICTIWFPNVSLGLNIWNQFVSIILGVVATILSIVSIIMGFKNYEDALELQEKYTQALETVNSIASGLANVATDVSNLKTEVHKISGFKPVTDGPADVSDNTVWGKEPPEKKDI